jgi:hypothetical protein
MHWWNPAPVAAALRADSFTERQKYHYLLAAVVIRALIGSSAVVAAHPNRASLLAALLALVLSVLGVRASYGQNRAGDDRAFIERYMCLTVPLIVQTYAVYLAIYYTSIVVARVARGGDLRSAAAIITPYVWLASLVLLIVYFWRLRDLIGKVSGARAI